MLVRIYDIGVPIGVVRLVDGKAVPDANLERWLSKMVVIDRQTRERVTFEDGERYLRWLPENLVGSYVSGVLEEDTES